MSVLWTSSGSARIKTFGMLELCNRLRAIASSEVPFDTVFDNRLAAQVSPGELLAGPAPRLLDEWQFAPDVWDAVRRACDDRGKRRGRGRLWLRVPRRRRRGPHHRPEALVFVRAWPVRGGCCASEGSGPRGPYSVDRLAGPRRPSSLLAAFPPVPAMR